MIRIQNVYYMLAYAFHVLNEQGYRNIAAENFDNTADLCAAILARGISTQIKRGLGREYIPRTESVSTLRGRIDITESIKTQTIHRKQLTCSYDEFAVDSYMNRIIKSTMLLLIGSDITRIRKKELRKLLVFFDDVGETDLHTVNWNMNYNRNNQTYRMLISICYLVVKGLLQTQSDGTVKLMDFLDEQRMCSLYERFILEFYRKEVPGVKASASKIDWQLDDEKSSLLPTMQSDIMLTRGDKTLIIDAKYYSRATQVQFGKHTLHSQNVYQIFTYVMNRDVGGTGNVAGLLLYAKTDEDITPDAEQSIMGHRISAKTLDLNRDFEEISKQLKSIASTYFGLS